ncbi:c-type cytochrome [Kaarinaea lacus]
MRNKQFAKLGATSLLLGMLVFLVSGPAYSKEPLDDVADFERLMDAVAYGDMLWHTGEGGGGKHKKLSTNGLGCANCHPDASATQPESWPKFQTNLGKVGTLREMINWCIQVVQNGTGYALDSKEMIAMEAYAHYMNRGARLNPGMNAQTAPYVISGPGYPTNDEGNR